MQRSIIMDEDRFKRLEEKVQAILDAIQGDLQNPGILQKTQELKTRLDYIEPKVTRMWELKFYLLGGIGVITVAIAIIQNWIRFGVK